MEAGKLIGRLMEVDMHRNWKHCGQWMTDTAGELEDVTGGCEDVYSGKQGTD